MMIAPQGCRAELTMATLSLTSF